LRSQGIPVYTYALTVQLTFPQQQPIGAFRFGITGPPGVYTVYTSTNLTFWEPLNLINVPLGAIFFADTEAHVSPKKFYRAVRQIPPTNMVFIPPTTFKMGSLPNDPDASADERPQTTVLLTRGYWIGKFEVTQGEYLSAMNTNPSTFVGDLSRPVESVTWSDATNYCAKLTTLHLAQGQIPTGSHYRLPTEAEWECAARAGTSTRFSYGDDLFYAELTSYAWFLGDGTLALITHPVGQKLPNPSGLYDVHGNVWEWCRDDYGPLPGGVQVDPIGPVSNSLQNKVARGGAYDYPNSSCRSASRLFRFPLSPDSDVGFRVVLVLGNLQ
jgi:formylglycine-generating enzyme required for sulfatase activity